MGKARGWVIACLLALWIAPAEAEEDLLTVLALGDSLTQGYGLPAEDGFVPQLSRWLSGQGVRVRLINAGVSGDTTAGGAARVEWSLGQDVDAMIVALGGNDLLRGLDPDGARANLSKILAAGEAAGVEMLLVGLPAPGNYGADYKTRFDAMFPELAAEYDAALYPDFFAGIRTAEGDRAAYFQRDGIHPNARGVARMVEDIGPSALRLVAAAE